MSNNILISNKGPVLSVVVPAYNESVGIEKALTEIISILFSCKVDWEIIVVDDGSKDDTYQKVCRLAQFEPRIKAISLSRNFGKEGAIFAGLEHATGEAVITIDADLQHPPVLIPDLLEKWQQGVQIVHAVKRARSQESMEKKARAYCINKLISGLGGININNSSDYKLLDAEIVDIIIHQLPERERFYRGLTSWLGFKEEYVYFDVDTRQGDKSKWSFLALLELAITALTSFTVLPLRIVTILGITTLVLGITVASEAIWSLFTGQAVSGFATTIICLLIIGSFIMISLGIIGEYIAKIYEEVKQRPLYLMKASVGFDERIAEKSLNSEYKRSAMR
ncbi:Glycosyltransferase [Methylomonas albis]|uniref:Glycosyltransferase family 2 protein n=1 Tax=Methylomonas albis TaxID=1854563 RepID=A0ABR9D7I2_9GAMM|nr:glycosyltransferase family 2 protein [Methylomonas albis]MBD9358746.1 glycosyltransferase family 2 protein [Methylomonas albis]CAD6882199.1 Glycosyltransferase [Methylomonas albis]